MSKKNETRETQNKKAKKQTKAALVEKLLLRPKGATLAEIADATTWLPHSARAFMTGLRKKGHELVCECRTDGETSWRIER